MRTSACPVRMTSRAASARGVRRAGRDRDAVLGRHQEPEHRVDEELARRGRRRGSPGRAARDPRPEAEPAPDAGADAADDGAVGGADEALTGQGGADLFHASSLRRADARAPSGSPPAATPGTGRPDPRISAVRPDASVTSRSRAARSAVSTPGSSRHDQVAAVPGVSIRASEPSDSTSCACTIANRRARRARAGSSTTRDRASLDAGRPPGAFRLPSAPRRAGRTTTRRRCRCRGCRCRRPGRDGGSRLVRPVLTVGVEGELQDRHPGEAQGRAQLDDRGVDDAEVLRQHRQRSERSRRGVEDRAPRTRLPACRARRSRAPAGTAQ